MNFCPRTKPKTTSQHSRTELTFGTALRWGPGIGYALDFSGRQTVNDGAVGAFLITGIIALSSLVLLLVGIWRAFQTVDWLGEVLVTKHTSHVS
jgi:hypothetical protein